MPTVLTDLASDLGISERTLRRFVAMGLVRAHRPSPRTVEVTPGERVYLRENWPTVNGLVQALRLEPGVRRAVLFGSTARGSAHDESDIDIAVWLKDDAVVSTLDLGIRMSERLGRKVQLVDMEKLSASSPLRAEIERDGRQLVDRSAG